MAEKIAVIGDIVLDVEHYCINKPNPESSAPCYLVKETRYRPGCAGNAAANLAKLGSDCTLISIIGEDERANRLENLLKNPKIKLELIKEKKRNTIKKERYRDLIDGRYHCRADHGEEAHRYIEKSQADEIIQKAKDYSLILVSDYNKGVVSRELMEGLKRDGVRIVADVKPVHKDFYKGIFMIKPNIKEVREMTKIDNEILAAETLGKELQTNVLLTRGKDGVSYFGLNGERYNFNSEIPSDKVIDVTGSGDTVIATFCHFFGKGYSLNDCIHLANNAGGIAVQYPGCYQVSEDELKPTLNCMNL
jgi:D-beta-D-heptose 7-phosphate kinase/D-beta-D-heptose 1-phosphate adenosyltransferase